MREEVEALIFSYDYHGALVVELLDRTLNR
jgi:hypothetical protein